MNSDALRTVLSIDGKIITKRCTEAYLSKIGMLSWLNESTPADFVTISDKIKYHLYGGGYCEVCGVRTRVDVSGRGFAKYCKEHFHAPKTGKRAHNAKDVDVELATKLYIEDKMSLLEIATTLGNVSNVTLKKKLVEAGVILRSHSENQSIHSGAKGKPAHNRITIDRRDLVEQYSIQRIPTKALAEMYGCHPETIRRFLAQEGVERTHRRSYIEWKIASMLQELGIAYRTDCKTLIPNYDIDFYLTDFNIGLEIHGLYTHSWYTGKKPKTYHWDKYSLSNENGIKLFQFWEHDVNHKLDVIQSMVMNACKLNQVKLNGRDCEVRDVDSKRALEFCELHHIQGAPSPAIKGIGLFHGDTLVSLMAYTVRKAHTKIERFCTIKGVSVRGAFSKLLKQLPGRTVITYSSNDISDGQLYQKAGFVCSRETRYDMWFTDYNTIINRQKFMKSKLEHLLEYFDSSKTEIENVIANGYDVIYKSGTKTWVLER